MLKTILFIFVFLVSTVSLANERDTVVLLTSVTHKKIDIEKKLENIFLKKLKNYPFKLKIIHKVDQEVLHRELTSVENKAVFWVSHGAFLKLRNQPKASLAPVNMILDYRKDNVAPIFQMLNPGLEFIGIVGCNSKQILESYREQNLWQNEADIPPMEYVSKTKSIAQFALKKAIGRFKKAWKYQNLPVQDLNVSYDVHPIKILVEMPSETPAQDIRAIRIMHKNKFIGMIPRLTPGAKVSIPIYIPKQDQFLNSNFNLTLTTGESINKNPDEIHFGKVEITDFSGNRWKLFAKSNGEPFGVNRRVFLYEGNGEILESTATIIR